MFMHRSPAATLVFPGPFESAAFYEQAFAATASGSIPHVPDAAGILVNHHLLGASLIVRALSVAATDDPLTVVLIAPDHFSAGAAPMTTVSGRWLTPLGDLESDGSAVRALVATGYVLAQPEPFMREHGITNLTAFIRYLYPDAELVPVIVKDSASGRAVTAVADVLSALSGPVLYIGSFDFTHEATMARAEANDARSIPIISALDTGRISEVAVDSHAGLELFLRVMRARGADEFTLLDSTNSARLTGNRGQTDTTSYINGFFR